MTSLVNVLWFIFEALINVFQAIIATHFTFSFLKFEGRKRTYRLLYFATVTVFSLIVEFFTYYTAFEDMYIFVYILILFVSTLGHFKGTLFEKLFASILPILVFAISATLSIQIISLTSGISTSKIVSPTPTFERLISIIIGNILIAYILQMLLHLFRRTKFKIKHSEWFLLFSMLCFAILIFLFLNLISFNCVFNNFARVLVIMIVLVVILSNVISYLLISRLSKKNEIESENELLKLRESAQANEALLLKKQYEELQKLKHDYKNQINMIEGLLVSNNQQEALSYLQKYTNVFNSTKHAVVHTENDYLNAILNNKFNTADDYNITVESTTIITSNINVDELDLCNLLGNLFDNAIEACQRCSQTKNGMQILFKLKCSDDQLIINIKNSISESVLQNNPEMSSSKKDKNNHGYGSKIIKNIIRKYSGFHDIYEQDKMFCQTIVLDNTK